MTTIELLKDQLLVTLSYFEPMSMEFIYLDLDQAFLMNHPELTIDDLKICLDQLVREKKIKHIEDQNTSKWVRIYPQKSLFKRILGLFS